MLLSKLQNILSVQFFFLRILLSGIIKNAFSLKNINCQIVTKNKKLSIDEQVLIELRIYIDLIIFFSSLEVIVLLSGIKVMTFVL